MSHLPSARGRVVSALPLPRELALGPPGVFEEGISGAKRVDPTNLLHLQERVPGSKLRSWWMWSLDPGMWLLQF